MSVEAWFQAMMAGGGANPLAVQYEDSSYVLYEDNDNTLYEG